MKETETKFLLVIDDRSYSIYETHEDALSHYKLYEEYYSYATLELIEIKVVKIHQHSNTSKVRENAKANNQRGRI